jgi:hypothetical protein
MVRLQANMQLQETDRLTSATTSTAIEGPMRIFLDVYANEKGCSLRMSCLVVLWTHRSLRLP